MPKQNSPVLRKSFVLVAVVSTSVTFPVNCSVSASPSRQQNFTQQLEHHSADDCESYHAQMIM
jgi:hypothetical protein